MIITEESLSTALDAVNAPEDVRDSFRAIGIEDPEAATTAIGRSIGSPIPAAFVTAGILVGARLALGLDD